MHWRELLSRIVVRVAALFVGRFHLPAKYFGYVYLRPVSRDELLASDQGAWQPGSYPALACSAPLPRNINQASDLPQKAAFGRPFAGYLSRELPAAGLFTVRDCKIASYQDRWHNDFSIVLDRNDHLLTLPHIEVNGGKGWDIWAGHSKVLRGKKTERIRSGIWIVENWSFNYYHWFVYHLPKLVLLKELHKNKSLIIPAWQYYPGYARASLEQLGFTDEKIIEPTADTVLVDELVIPIVASHDPRLVRATAEALFPNVRSNNRKNIYISRKKAERRRVVNEDQVITYLESVGFVTIFAEELSLWEQIAFMRDARIIISPHGAGLTNMIFAPRGTHVVEFVNPGFPSSDYYALATSLDHQYWLFLADDASKDGDPIERDMYIEIDRLDKLLGQCLDE